MSNIPSELKYTSSHEWVKREDDGRVRIGITDHAQQLLGDLVFVELPELGTETRSGDDVGVVESVKAASDIYSPLTGEIVGINEDLNDNPALINSDPYSGGWIFEVRPADENELNDLLDADHYEELVEAEA